MNSNILPDRDTFVKMPRAERQAIIRQLANTLDEKIQAQRPVKRATVKRRRTMVLQ